MQSFNDQEKELFQKYGKVPSHKGLLANKLKVSQSVSQRRRRGSQRPKLAWASSRQRY